MGHSYHAIDSDKYVELNVLYLSFSLFCLTLSTFFIVNLITMGKIVQSHVNVYNDEGCVLVLPFQISLHEKNLNTYIHHVNSTEKIQMRELMQMMIAFLILCEI